MPRYSNASGNPTLAAQNAVFGPIVMPKGSRASVSLKTGAANPVGADFVLEADFGDQDWIAFGLTKPSDGSNQVSLTGPSKAGVVPFNMAAVYQVRARRTDATAGNAVVVINITQDN